MTTPISRRRALQIGAVALPLVHIRTAGAAGKLALAFWDHWVPGGNDAMTRQIDAWARKNQVEASIDYMSAGNKLVITAAAEDQAKTGHDVISLPVWEVHNHAHAFEPVDDVMQRLIVEIRANQRGIRVSREDRRPLDGRSEQLRRAEPAAMRAYRRTEGQGRPRSTGDVSG